MEDYYLPGTAGALNFLGRSVSTRSPIPITTGSGGWEKLGSGATRSGAAGQESANGNGADRDGAVTERAWRKRLGPNLPLVHLRGLAPLCTPVSGDLSRFLPCRFNHTGTESLRYWYRTK